MKFRAAASVALAAAVALGLAGCNMISPQRTTMSYDASDGVSASVGDFELRNVLVLVDQQGAETPTSGKLVLTVVDAARKGGSIKVAAPGAATTITVPANQPVTTVGFGEGAEQITIDGVDLAPGGLVELTFTAAGGSSETVAVPILDGTLAEYATLLPTAPAPEAPDATATGTPGATPGETVPGEQPATAEPTTTP